MTAAELARMRDLVSRNAMLERENERLRASFIGAQKRRRRDVTRLRSALKAQCTRRQKAIDAARRLHGILLANGIEVRL